ncbi:MAG: hypothetical protein Q8O43_00595 [Dehalococcoidia bacterium]|nr:hypothetical protein [Dehalococcoidia bacterium]
MKRKILAILITMALVGAALFQVLPASADTPGPLDHVQVTPANAAVVAGATKQFTAKAFDATNHEITGLTFTWAVVAGGGTIDANGLFTAGTTTGPFHNTVQASTTQNTITKTGLASVTVTAPPATPAPARLKAKMISGLLRLFVKTVGFDNFLGGQWSVKNGTAIDTVKVIPGVVKTVSATSLSILPNGQTTNRDFVLSPDTVILPKGAELKVDDRVVVITVNDNVQFVVKITAPGTTSNRLPPGLARQGKDRDEDKKVPPGWSKGKKAGWDKEREPKEKDSEDDED